MIKKFFKSRKKLTLIIVFALLVIVVGGYFVHSIYSWKKAEEYFKTAQYQKVIDEIGNQPMPSDPQKLDIYGRSMMATRQLDKAYAAYEKLNAISKSLDNTLIMANIQSEKGNTDQAEKLYQEVIDENPHFIQAYLNLASLYRLKGDKAKANEILLKGVTNNPDSPSIYDYLLSINEDNSKSADYKGWLEKLKKLDPNNSRFL